MTTKKPKKLWIVKREVLAANLKEALSKPGRVYEVMEAAKEYQPEEEKKPVIGFDKK